MKLVELIIRTLGPKKIFSDENTFKKALELRRKEVKYKIPNIKFKTNISKEQVNNCDIIHLSNSNNNNKIIIYLHGGAYVSEASVFHFKFIDKISKQSETDIYFPIYPLAPNHNYKETYDLLLSLYKKLLKDNKEIILMGDSAGGGLALAFTQYLNELKIKGPTQLILISPWIDISMTNPNIKEYEDIDPMLSSYGLIECGKIWADNLELKDHKVSPIYGNLNNIPQTILFVGTRELFYPDICLLHQKLKNNGINSELIIGKDMNHVYPLYPIKAGNKAKKKIIEIIKNNG